MTTSNVPGSTTTICSQRPSGFTTVVPAATPSTRVRTIVPGTPVPASVTGPAAVALRNESGSSTGGDSGVAVDVAVGVKVDVALGGGVAVPVDVDVGSGVAVDVGVPVAVLVAVGAGVGVATTSTVNGSDAAMV
jgi:hypothetical protein